MLSRLQSGTTHKELRENYRRNQMDSNKKYTADETESGYSVFYTSKKEIKNITYIQYIHKLHDSLGLFYILLHLSFPFA